MKLFEISEGATIVEPPMTNSVLAVVYLGQKYLALLVGSKMPKGTKGLKEVNWQEDTEVRAAAVADMKSSGNPDEFDGERRNVYEKLTAPTEAEQQAALIAGIRAEVGRRILEHASQSTQMNLSAAAGGGILSEEQMAAYRAGLMWIAQVRQTGKALVEAVDPDFANDEKWPKVPEATAELAAQF
ncbi:conserved hypothetical protein [Roseibium sp. TrichSKD4]|uniref:hypothetical protein n=1 Tax=Roseibium sp. TrichSKD4 TaxID=744980 RepID=UPI0001E56332|nr:hypothetical protein [Roseibium sp. TrichSKD4]EFO33890.1 conserved hypothetical protein [Roseibium sp. TrichSKD4]